MKIAKLTLVEITPERWRGNVVALWRCDCGNEKLIPMVRVKVGHAKSCGCLRLRHGHTKRREGKSAEYTAWQAMHARCRATSGRDYDAYSARGISICAQWAGFEAFFADLGLRPSPKHSLGRINNDLGYSPGNCRWETPIEQQRNKRASKLWHIKGTTFGSSREAAAHFNVDHHTIRYWVSQKKDGCHVSSRY